ncbi:hypothetical protein N9383_05900, partial [Granulosicoccus sp.]|nr:hypothetical protein [Granulosicoccus sp.]
MSIITLALTACQIDSDDTEVVFRDIDNSAVVDDEVVDSNDQNSDSPDPEVPAPPPSESVVVPVVDPVVQEPAVPPNDGDN